MAGIGAVASPAAQAQARMGQSPLPAYARAQHYRSLKQSSYDRTGGNHDFWNIPAGGTKEVFRADGAGVISHVWFTIAAQSEHHLKELVLRAYWDGNPKPSVETPIGDFFGLNLAPIRFTNPTTWPARPANRSTAISPCPTASRRAAHRDQ